MLSIRSFLSEFLRIRDEQMVNDYVDLFEDEGIAKFDQLMEECQESGNIEETLREIGVDVGGHVIRIAWEIDKMNVIRRGFEDGQDEDDAHVMNEDDEIPVRQKVRPRGRAPPRHNVNPTGNEGVNGWFFFTLYKD